MAEKLVSCCRNSNCGKRLFELQKSI